ncbi:MAG TPA: helix-turn-helix domain-containing protein [Bacillota bacterium]|nr:helix-turn-helix domain-containing protein [Bacillota bacterium]
MYVELTEKNFINLQPFVSVEEMNEAIRIHKANHDLSQTDRKILDVISRYACKFVGVCYLRKQRIAEEAGFTSRRTAIRACNRLEKLGIIKQHKARRASGDKRQTANIIIIQPVQRATLQEEPSDKQLSKTADTSNNLSNPCQRKSQKYFDESHQPDTPESHRNKPLHNHNKEAWDTYKETDRRIEHSLAEQIPEKIYQAFSPFFQGEKLYDIYGILLRAKAAINPQLRIEDHAEKYIATFLNTLRLYKWGKVKSLHNYLYVAWERLTAEITRKHAWQEKVDLQELYTYF